MSTRSKKGAIGAAVETLTQTTAPTAPESTVPESPLLYLHGDLFVQGRLGLATDPDVVRAAAAAIEGEDTVRALWVALSDTLYTKGIKASDLAGKTKKEETFNEVRDLIGTIKFGNFVAAMKADGTKIPAVADIRAFWGDHKGAHWLAMSTERRRMAQSRAKDVSTYLSRLVNALQGHEDTKTGTKKKITLEEHYLNLLAPVLAFLQGIDQTKVDPKFDWNEEFAAIGSAVARAKKAKILATTAPATVKK